MGCSCCGDTCDAGPVLAKKGPDASEVGRRARHESRVQTIRFALSFALFAAGYAVPTGSALRLALFVTSWLVSGYRVALHALRNIAKGGVFDENFLMTVATVGAFAIGEWPEGAAVMLFYNLGELVQESAVAKSRRSISDLVDVRPDTARLADSGEIVHPSVVALGSIIRVVPGERVPLDGTIVSGTTAFDTASLTGESLPRPAGPGDRALAGFINGSAPVDIRTETGFADTAAAKMLALIEDAQHRKARAERFITAFARIYTPIVTIAAAAMAVLVPLGILAASGSIADGSLFTSGGPVFSEWVGRALVFLVISCPCAFVISVPLGYFGGIGGAAKRGVLVKGADFLDVLARTKAVVFDKTGTLTTGRFKVTGIQASEGGAKESVARLAAVAEAHTTHPLALAIREAFSEWAGHESAAADYAERPGFGVSCRLEGAEILAGSPAWLREKGVRDVPEMPAEARGQTSVEIARGGKWAGRVTLEDAPKPDSAEAIRRLRGLGIERLAMVTGDGEAAARRTADALGIEEIHAEVLPHRKVEVFEAIRDSVIARYPKGTVVFSGDGINDAAVLARSDAGIAMGVLGSDAAIESADVVIADDNPSRIADAVLVARKTRAIVAQNIVLSFVVKIGFLALGAAGIATLWEAVFADVGVALLATLNAVRARSAGVR